MAALIRLALLCLLSVAVTAQEPSFKRKFFSPPIPAGDVIPPPAPECTIDTPTAATTYQTSVSAITIGGTCVDQDGTVSKVVVSSPTASPTSVNAVLAGDRFTAVFSAQSEGLNTFTVVATDNGSNTSEPRALQSTYTPADVTDPVVIIQSPNGGNNFTDDETPVTIAGSCADNVACTSLSWLNAANGLSGACAGTASFSCVVPVETSGNLITVTGLDQAGNDGTDTITGTITFPVAITTAALPNGEDNEAYSACVNAAGGTSPYAWSVASGTIPTGTTFNTAATGLQACFSGTPTTPGDYTFTIRIEDDNGVFDTQAFTVTIAVEGAAEGPNDFYEFQRNARQMCSATVTENCLVPITNCLTEDPTKGQCSGRVDAQLSRLSKGTRTANGWHYLYSAGNAFHSIDTHPERTDLARNQIGHGVKKINGPDQLEINFRTTADLATARTLTLIHENLYTSEWLAIPCGGNVNTNGEGDGGPDYQRLGYKLGRLMAERPPGISGTHEYLVTRVRPDQFYAQQGCTGLPGGWAYTFIGSQWGSASTALMTTEGATPAAIGVNRNEFPLHAPGPRAYWGPGADDGSNGGRYPARVASKMRLIVHLEKDVPADDPRLDGWRAGCGGAGTQNALCAAMLSAVPDPDSTRLFTLVTYIVSDTTRGGQMTQDRVPFWNAVDRLYQYRLEYDTSSSGSGGQVTTYFGNMLLIKNIDPNDLLYTGCPSACPGDVALSTNIIRKTVQ